MSDPTDRQESFTVQCAYTLSLSDDPIVFPNQSGARTLHDFSMYPIQNARTVMLASEPLYTFHAGFSDSWDQEALRRLLHG